MESNQLTYKGVAYRSITELVEFWNASGQNQFASKAENVAARLRKWRQKNPESALTDQVIESCLIPRSSENSLIYRGQIYNGPTAVYAAIDSVSEVPFKTFFANLTAWRKSNPGATPDDATLEDLTKRTRLKTADGRFVGALKRTWETAPEPKLSWSAAFKKITTFRKRYFRDPDANELAEMFIPQNWLSGTIPENFRGEDGRLLSISEVYELIEGDKCSITAFAARIRKFRDRTGLSPNATDLQGLVKTWGVVDRSQGTLYKWTHKTTGRVYIGITTEDLRERIRGHLRQAQDGPRPEGGLHETLAKDGIEAFEIETISRHDSIEELMTAERKSIENHRALTPNGFNLDVGGKGVSARMVPLEFRGVRYKNLAALSAAFGLPVKRLESRLRLGWSFDAAVDNPSRQFHRNTNPYNLTGDVSVRTLAEREGVNHKLVYERLKSGWSMQEALEIVPRHSRLKDNPTGRTARDKEVFVSGHRFRSHAQAAKHFGIKEGAWRKRISLGWSPEQAAGLEPKLPKKRINRE